LQWAESQFQFRYVTIYHFTEIQCVLNSDRDARNSDRSRGRAAALPIRRKSTFLLAVVPYHLVRDLLYSEPWVKILSFVFIVRFSHDVHETNASRAGHVCRFSPSVCLRDLNREPLHEFS
jgi:hypothetical protein